MNNNLRLLNEQPRLTIPIGTLRVSPYEIKSILDVEIRQKINEHSTITIKGVLFPGQENKYAEMTTVGTNIILSTVYTSENAPGGPSGEEYEDAPGVASGDISGEEFVLFQGLVQDVRVNMEKEEPHITIRAISHSYLLDVKKKSRSFQNKKKTYTDLMEQVTSPYPGADVIDAVTFGVPTDKFIMQHRETDWEFIRRMASHFNTGLICDVRYDTPKYFFGVPRTQVLELDSKNYSTKKDVGIYEQLSQNGVRELNEQHFEGCEIETNCVMRIGDTVLFQEKQLYVSEIRSLIKKSNYISRLTLVPEKGLRQPYQPNTAVVGASYGGSILERKNDQVKISLETDWDHDPGEPCFFPYSTIYSSRDGSGWYCMPEVGDKIRLHFPDGEDDHAFAISSVHKHVDPATMPSRGKIDDEEETGGGAPNPAGSYSGLRDDPDVKSITYGDREVRLSPEGIHIILGDGAIINLTEEGIVLITENDITFQSEKNITLAAEDDVNIVGTDSVNLKCQETASIIIDENIQAVGQEVKSN